MANRRKLYLLAFLSLLVPAIVWAVSEVITRDSTQTPCSAIDELTNECRNLRYNTSVGGLDVNIKGGGTFTVGTVNGTITPADAFSNPTTAITNQGLNQGWNGATWDRLRTASASTLTAGTTTGATLIEKGPRWFVLHTPAVNSQATATRSAGGGSTRHVADCVSYSLSAATAPAATALTINLRDGASGAGTIIWSKQLVAPATAGTHTSESFCGLNIPGSAATAMTLEFSAGLTNELESVNLTGYDAS